MKIKDESNQGPRLNMTSLIDVVFLLLIFFMVTTTFEKQAKLKIALPEATQEATTQAQQQIVIAISQKGVIYLNNNELLNSQYDTISKALEKMIASDEEKTLSVIVRADENAAHKFVVTVMDVLADLGVSSISIATTPSK